MLLCRRMLLTLLAFVSLTTLAAAEEHTKESPKAVKENIEQKKAVLLDVREEAEWKEGHLKAASLLPLSKLKEGQKLDSVIKDLKPGTVVYCHCRAGRRALEAAELLKKQGIDARALKPGYADLLKEGFEQAK